MATTTDDYALSRLAFGANEASVRDLSRQGLHGWMAEQLSPEDAGDAECNRRIADLRLRIRYAAGKDWPAVDESRPVMWMDAPIEKLFSLADSSKAVPPPEKARPRQEVAAATLLRAVYTHSDAGCPSILGPLFTPSRDGFGEACLAFFY